MPPRAKTPTYKDADKSRDRNKIAIRESANPEGSLLVSKLRVSTDVRESIVRDSMIADAKEQAGEMSPLDGRNRESIIVDNDELSPD